MANDSGMKFPSPKLHLHQMSIHLLSTIYLVLIFFSYTYWGKSAFHFQLERREKKGKSKCPSRRHRRRPSNLLSEYQRRQRNNAWLETHIWHAKRFKMTTAWGYRLPLHPSDKSLRACYRATTYHCLLQVGTECYMFSAWHSSPSVLHSLGPG